MYKVGQAIHVKQKVSHETHISYDATVVEVYLEREELTAAFCNIRGEIEETCVRFSEIADDYISYGGLNKLHLPENTFQKMLTFYKKDPGAYFLQIAALSRHYMDIQNREIREVGKPSQKTLDHLYEIDKLLLEVKNATEKETNTY